MSGCLFGKSTIEAFENMFNDRVVKRTESLKHI
jgi:hypothetical protein